MYAPQVCPVEIRIFARMSSAPRVPFIVCFRGSQRPREQVEVFSIATKPSLITRHFHVMAGLLLPQLVELFREAPNHAPFPWLRASRTEVPFKHPTQP